MKKLMLNFQKESAIPERFVRAGQNKRLRPSHHD